MGILFAAFLYNAITIPLRASFDVYGYLPAMVAFFVVDYICDMLYVMDMALIQSHLSFRNNGVLEVQYLCNVRIEITRERERETGKENN